MGLSSLPLRPTIVVREDFISMRHIPLDSLRRIFTVDFFSLMSPLGRKHFSVDSSRQLKKQGVISSGLIMSLARRDNRLPLKTDSDTLFYRQLHYYIPKLNLFLYVVFNLVKKYNNNNKNVYF